jgi:hypothetical protein
MRHFATVILGCLFCAQACAQHTTEFLFSETAPKSVRKTMQTNVKAVFAEINRAYDQNKSGLALASTAITEDAGKRIQTLWATSHFYCTETGITTRVLKSGNSYQVRNIPVYFAQGKTDEDKYQDVVIEFTASGKISDLLIAIPHPSKIMGNSNKITDMQRRQMILDYLENFRTAFGRKDFHFVHQVFRDDPLIITGKTLKKSDKDSVKMEYVINSKEEYLANLKKVFASNSYINAKFDNIAVTRHSGNPNVYGITLLLKWESSSGYSDEGWLFQIIDFEDENNPQIWVTTWQPTKDINGNPIHYKSEDIFSLIDFPIR